MIRPEQAELEEIRELEGYIKEQLNVRTVSFSTDRSKYGIELRAEPEIPVLGRRLGKEAKNVFAGIRALSSSQIEELKSTGTMQVNGHQITKDEIRIRFNARSEVMHYILYQRKFLYKSLEICFCANFLTRNNNSVI